MLGWTVGGDGNPTYQIFTTGDPDGVHGGLFATDGQLASYAVFSVIVEDVAATCRRPRRTGGKVQRAPKVNPDGLTSPTSWTRPNHFEIFSPPPVA